MADFVRVASVSEIAAGQGKVIELADKTIAVFNCDGTFYAIDNTCKHQGGPLGEGDLAGTVVTCPWHGWTYDVSTGISPDDPECAVERYEVKVEGADVMVAIP